VVVHLDLDILVLKPLDALFDWMLMDTTTDPRHSNVPVMWPELEMPQHVNAFFTRDCTFHRGSKFCSCSSFRDKLCVPHVI
jgi:hypothetical protein